MVFCDSLVAYSQLPQKTEYSQPLLLKGAQMCFTITYSLPHLPFALFYWGAMPWPKSDLFFPSSGPSPISPTTHQDSGTLWVTARRFSRSLSKLNCSWTSSTKSAVCSTAENFHFIPFHPKSISGLCLQTAALDTQGELTVTQKSTKVPLDCWNIESMCCYSQQIKNGKATNCLSLVVFVSSLPPQHISALWCTHVSIVGQTLS